jgi:MFS family permease
MRDTWHATPFVAALPFICFQSGMVLGRFTADSITARIGRARMLLFSGLVGGLGEITGLLVGHPYGIIFGWSCVGLGVAAVIPMNISICGIIVKKNYDGVVAPAQAVATATGVAYSAFLIGPPVIGFISDLIGLRWAMLIPATLVLCVTGGARIAQRAGA